MRIYIAGPYGDQLPKDQIRRNVEAADNVARALAKMGHTPFCPHKMTWGWEDDPELDKDDFLRIDLEWLELCDALFFIAPSPGADIERREAERRGIKVFTKLEEVPPNCSPKPEEYSEESERRLDERRTGDVHRG
jgi:hypothetical protein